LVVLHIKGGDPPSSLWCSRQHDDPSSQSQRLIKNHNMVNPVAARHRFGQCVRKTVQPRTHLGILVAQVSVAPRATMRSAIWDLVAGIMSKTAIDASRSGVLLARAAARFIASR
jgi:hypothetical protein